MSWEQPNQPYLSSLNSYLTLSEPFLRVESFKPDGLSAYSSHLLGYPRRDLRPAIQHLLALHREACQIKAEHILPQMRSTNQPLPSLVAPDELPRTIPEYGDEQCMAYVAWQMPLAYGCLERIMTDLKKRIPTFNPQTIFDFGTGPGTAIMYSLDTHKYLQPVPLIAMFLLPIVPPSSSGRRR